MISFKVGDRVAEILNPDAFGEVVGVREAAAGIAQYDVAWDAGTMRKCGGDALLLVQPRQEPPREAPSPGDNDLERARAVEAAMEAATRLDT